VESAHKSNIAWLLRLRLGAVVSEAALVLLVNGATIPLPVGRLFVIFGVALATNVALWLFSRRASRVSEHVIGGVLAFDVAALTLALAITGGPLNPFSSLYLVYIALGAVVLSVRWTWILVVLSGGAFAGLFVVSSESLWGPDHATHMRIHLKGMWLAFSVAAVFVGYFGGRIQRALAEREAELAAIRARQARSEKLAALATLAAGAAHELSTPLSTIAVVARELETELARSHANSLLEDARLIRGEVARCRKVLDQLSADVGSGVGDAPQDTTIGDVIARAKAGLPDHPPIVVEVAAPLDARSLRLPSRPLELALRSVIENAQQASPSQAPVVVRARSSAAGVTIEVADRGTGMPADVLARVGEPFFTTKEPGRGMGLGVFLARSVIEQLHGELSIDSSPNGGTTVRLDVPCLTT